MLGSLINVRDLLTDWGLTGNPFFGSIKEKKCVKKLNLGVCEN